MLKNSEILSIYFDIRNWRNSPALMYFNRSKIADFFKEYGMKAQELEKRLNENDKEFLVLEEGKYKSEPDENGQQQLVIQEGKTRDQYNANIVAIMSNNTPSLIRVN